MGNFAKFSESSKSALQSLVDTSITQITKVTQKASTYQTDANTTADGWKPRIIEQSRQEPNYDDQQNITGYTTYYWTNYNTTETTSSAKSRDDADCDTNYVTPYKKDATKLVTETGTLTNQVKETLDKITTLLTKITTASTTFDGNAVNLQAALDALEAANLADNIEVVDGVMMYNVYDADGNVAYSYTLGEMVNGFFTYTGTAMSTAIATGLTYGENIPEGFANYIAGIGNNVYQLMGQGFMSVAAQGDIEAMYQDVAAANGWGDLASEYKKLLAEGTFAGDKTLDEVFAGLGGLGLGGLITGGAAMSAGIVTNLSKGGASPFSEEHSKTANDRLSQHSNKKAETPAEETPTPETPSEETPTTETPTEETTTDQTPTTETSTWTNNPSSSSGSSGGSSGGSDSGSDDGGSDDDYPTAEETGGTTPETDNRFTEVVETELPEEPVELEVTNQDIDDMARDAFYEKYSVPEDLAARRAQDIAEFEELFESENKDALIEKFLEMGYDPAEAIGAASNKDVGLAAYLLGSQNQELTEIAQEFAKELGIEETFDTSFDDAPDYEDLFDGDAAVELTDPSASPEIVEAKADVAEAKEAYNTAVETANTSLADVTKAKSDLEALRESIEKSAGNDTTKWSTEQINQYNKAVEEYNTAATKASEDLKAVETAKTTYTEAKTNLDKVEETYFDKIREENKSDSLPTDTGNNGDSGTGGTMTGGGQNNNSSEELTDEQLKNGLLGL